MTGWLEHARDCLAADEPAIRVTIAGVRGSAPRETGASMVVTRSHVLGTIGGGQLEYRCTGIACDLLREGRGGLAALERFPLGADCGQCCGGVVDVLFEDLGTLRPEVLSLLDARDRGLPALLLTWRDAGGEFRRVVATAGDAMPDLGRSAAAAGAAAERALEDGFARRVGGRLGDIVLLEPVVASGFDIAVFGAGHLGSALVAVLAGCDADIRWFDSRPDILPATTPANVHAVCSAAPAEEVGRLPKNARVLVLTHSHPLDYEICRAVLRRDEFAYLGLIGSRTKRRRFEYRLRQEGIAGLERLICPIGIDGIRSKKPAEIAVGVAAELLRHRDLCAGRASNDGARPAGRRRML